MSHALPSPRSKVFFSVLFVAGSLALPLGGCPKRVPSPTEVLERAARDAAGADADARTLALAAFHGWLVEGDASRAQERLEKAVAKDPREPWALYGQHLLARRAERRTEATTLALALVGAAPEHPLAAVCARFVINQVNTAPTLDGQILTATSKILDSGPPADVAHLLRSARALIFQARGDADAQRAEERALGTVDHWALVGPFSPWTHLDFDQALPPEGDGKVAGPFSTPHGEVKARALHVPDGRFSLGAEGGEGNLFVLATDLEVPEGGDFLVRTVSSAAHRVRVNGILVLRGMRPAPSVHAAKLSLQPGTHRVLVVLSRDDGWGNLALSLMRADGSPANFTARPAEGAPASWTVADGRAAAAKLPRGVLSGTADVFWALEDEVGGALAAFVAVRDGMVRDAEGAHRVGAPLFEGQALSPALLALRAALWLEDDELPQRVARARATRDLEAALSKDPQDVASLLLRARLALDDGRQQEASEWTGQAKAASSPPPYAVTLLRARVELSLGLDAQAAQHAKEALQATPGLCEANALLYDLARRRDAVGAANEALGALAGCREVRLREVSHARVRGDLETAVRLQAALHEAEPLHQGHLFELASLYVSAERYGAALEKLEAARTRWPRNGRIVERMAEVQALAGRAKEALALREAALSLAGGDLSLRRRVHREKTGRELLEEHAVDGQAAITRYREQPGTRDAQTALVLDAAAVEGFADGSRIDRIHIIQRALSQDGVSDIGEVHLPPGAAVLQLRTIKGDGTVLEPEDIAGKDSISMPGVEVGDFVQYEYLEAHGPRGPAMPGFTAPAFYFRLAGVPNVWSTYTVLSPKDAPLKVDGGNLKLPEPRLEGGKWVLRHEERHVPPYIPEPNAPPSVTEYLPWIQAGTGATGNEALVTRFGDALFGRARVNFEVERFAKATVGALTGEDAVRALHRAVMHEVQGRDAGLSLTAASTLAAERGSRLWLLKASLEAVGIPARVAAIGTLHVDPREPLFPNESRMPYVALRAELPDGRHLWLDPAVRFGPFGQLPEQAHGQEAWLFPEPGRPQARVQTPSWEVEGKAVSLKLTLLEDGTLQGEGEERYAGFEGAQLSEALEGLPEDHRRQALQGALSTYFGGAEMEALEVGLVGDVAEPLVVRYRFRVPRFARQEADRWVLGALTYPVNLGRRFVQVGRRTTPLFIDSSERTRTSIELVLPEGRTLQSPLGELGVKSAQGHFLRREKQEGRRVLIEEDFLLHKGRVPVNAYEEFSHFAGQVGLLQTRDLEVK